jgi:hypothetical protein
MDSIVSGPKGLGRPNFGVLAVAVALVVFWAAFAMAVMHLV